MHRHQRLKGFTLVELLFLVAVIGVIAAMIMNSYQQRANNLKVEKTALQMQQILQAGLNYFKDNGCWPNKCGSNPVPSFNAYLPFGIINNSWGNAYSFSADPNNASNFQVFSGKIPTSQLIDRVVAILPNAKIDPQDSTQIITQSQVTFSGKYIIQQISNSGVLGDKSNATFNFVCPNGWIPGAIALPQYIYTYDQISNFLQICYGYGIGSQAIASLDTQNMNCQISNSQCTYQVTFSSFWQRYDFFSGCTWFLANAGYIAFNQIGFCENPNPNP